MARKKPEITCEVEFTEGAMDRITQAFVDLYYAIKDGIHTGPLPESKQKDKTAQAVERRDKPYEQCI